MNLAPRKATQDSSSSAQPGCGFTGRPRLGSLMPSVVREAAEEGRKWKTKKKQGGGWGRGGAVPPALPPPSICALITVEMYPLVE